MSFRSFISVLAFSILSLGLRAGLANSAAEAVPLPVGSPVPAVTLQAIDGSAFDLTAAVAQKPTVLIFYRGSWCPYCNKHLATLAEIEPQLLELGYQILAVSPDDAPGLQNAADKNHLNYRLLSDSTKQASAAFGVAFRVDGKTVAAYRGYGIELKAVPGAADARWLPVPAVFVLGRDGVIKFVHSDPDYKVRLSAAAVLAAARAALR